MTPTLSSSPHRKWGLILICYLFPHEPSRCVITELCGQVYGQEGSVCSHHTLPQSPGWRRKLPGQETPLSAEGGSQSWKHSEGDFWRGETQRPWCCPPEQRKRDHSGGRHAHTETKTEKKGGDRPWQIQEHRDRRTEAERNKSETHRGGEWDSGTRYGFFLSEKVRSCRGSASWYQELPHFPGEEADLKRVPDVRFKQKLQAAEQDSLWYWASLSLIKSSSEEARETTTIAQSPSRVWLFVTPWTAARQDSLSFTISWSLLGLTSMESGILFIYLILCRPRGKREPLESSASCPGAAGGFVQWPIRVTTI